MKEEGGGWAQHTRGLRGGGSALGGRGSGCAAWLRRWARRAQQTSTPARNDGEKRREEREFEFGRVKFHEKGVTEHAFAKLHPGGGSKGGGKEFGLMHACTHMIRTRVGSYCAQHAVQQYVRNRPASAFRTAPQLQVGQQPKCSARSHHLHVPALQTREPARQQRSGAVAARRLAAARAGPAAAACTHVAGLQLLDAPLHVAPLLCTQPAQHVQNARVHALEAAAGGRREGLDAVWGRTRVRRRGGVQARRPTACARGRRGWDTGRAGAPPQLATGQQLQRGLTRSKTERPRCT